METTYNIEFVAKGRLSVSAMENLKTIVGYASRHHGIEIEVVQIKERCADPFKNKLVSEAP